MFIEKISYKSLAKFIEQHDVRITKIARNNERVCINSRDLVHEQNITFYLKDFNAEVNYDYFQRLTTTTFQDDWRKFLYAEFGEQYKTAIENHLNNQTKKVMNKLIRNI